MTIPDDFRPPRLFLELSYSAMCLFIPLLVFTLPNMQLQEITDRQQQQQQQLTLGERLQDEMRDGSPSSCRAQRAAGWLLPSYPCEADYLLQVSQDNQLPYISFLPYIIP